MTFKRKTDRRETTETQRAAVIALFRAGVSFRKITELEAIPKSTAYNIIRRWKLCPESALHSKKRPGVPSKLSKRDRQKLCAFA